MNGEAVQEMNYVRVFPEKLTFEAKCSIYQKKIIEVTNLTEDMMLVRISSTCSQIAMLKNECILDGFGRCLFQIGLPPSNLENQSSSIVLQIGKHSETDKNINLYDVVVPLEFRILSRANACIGDGRELCVVKQETIDDEPISGLRKISQLLRIKKAMERELSSKEPIREFIDLADDNECAIDKENKFAEQLEGNKNKEESQRRRKRSTSNSSDSEIEIYSSSSSSNESSDVYDYEKEMRNLRHDHLYCAQTGRVPLKDAFRRIPEDHTIYEAENTPCNVIQSILRRFNVNDKGYCKCSRKRSPGDVTEKITFTQTGTPIIVFEGHEYIVRRTKTGGIFTACCIAKQCPGRIVVNHLGAVVNFSDCEHYRTAKIKGKKLLARSIRSHETDGSTPEAAASAAILLAKKMKISRRFVEKDPIKRSMRRSTGDPDCVNKYGPIVDCNKYKNLINICDNAENIDNAKNVVIGWCTEASLDLFENTKTVFVDGKFIGTKKHYRQIYAISSSQGKDNLYSVPLAFFSLNGKSTNNYLLCFEALKSMGLSPDYVFMDFEVAAKNAAERVWTGVNVCYCYVHFARNVSAKFREVVGKELFQNDDFVDYLEMFISLAIAPIPSINQYFDYLCMESLKLSDQIDPEKLIPFFNYFSNFYLKTNKNFPVNYWNCRERCLRKLPFANNFAEHIFSKLEADFTYKTCKYLGKVIEKSQKWMDTSCEIAKNSKLSANHKPRRHCLSRDVDVFNELQTADDSPKTFFENVSYKFFIPKLHY